MILAGMCDCELGALNGGILLGIAFNSDLCSFELYAYGILFLGSIRRACTLHP